MIYKSEITCHTNLLYTHGNNLKCSVCSIQLPVTFVMIRLYIGRMVTSPFLAQDIPYDIIGVCSSECEHMYILKGEL